jgi:hypothetical protein
MKKSIALLMIAVLIFLTSCGGENNMPVEPGETIPGQSSEITPPPAVESPPEPPEEIEPPSAPESSEAESSIPESSVAESNTERIIDGNNLAWIVEPVLEYDRVSYCRECGYFADASSYSTDYYPYYNINEETGQIIDEHGGHGYETSLVYAIEWVIDKDEKLFGRLLISGYKTEKEIYSIDDEFALRFPDSTDTLNPTKEFAMSEVSERESVYEGGIHYDMGSRFENSKYAIAYGNTFITDFVFDGVAGTNYRYGGVTYNNAIPVSIGGKWSFIDKNGNEITPFIFDHAISADGDTAFVKYNGKYGILDVIMTGELNNKTA